MRKSMEGAQGQSLVLEDITAQLRMCAHTGDVDTAAALVEVAELRKEATVEMYNFVIHACVASENPGRAEMAFHRLRTFGLEPNVVTFNSLINACAKIGDAARAEEWLTTMMVDYDVAPNAVTVGTLCKLFARQGLVEQVRDLMCRYERTGGTLNEYFFATLISACGAAQPVDKEGAVAVFEEMVERGLKAQSVKRVLERVVGIRKAAQLFSTLPRAREGVAPPRQAPAVAAGAPAEGEGSAQGRLGPREVALALRSQRRVDAAAGPEEPPASTAALPAFPFAPAPPGAQPRSQAPAQAALLSQTSRMEEAPRLQPSASLLLSRHSQVGVRLPVTEGLELALKTRPSPGAGGGAPGDQGAAPSGRPLDAATDGGEAHARSRGSIGLAWPRPSRRGAAPAPPQAPATAGATSAPTGQDGQRQQQPQHQQRPQQAGRRPMLQLVGGPGDVARTPGTSGGDGAGKPALVPPAALRESRRNGLGDGPSDGGASAHVVAGPSVAATPSGTAEPPPAYVPGALLRAAASTPWRHAEKIVKMAPVS